MASTARGAGFGAFLQSLGQSGMGISQMLADKKEKEQKAINEAPTRNLNFSILKDVAASKSLALKKEKDSFEKDKVIAGQKKQLLKLLSKPEIREYMERITDKELSKLNMPIPEARQGMVTTQTEERAPTLQEQIGRVKGTEYEYDPNFKDVIDPLKKEYQSTLKPGLEQEKFEREQAGKIKLQELKGEQAMEKFRLSSAEKLQLAQARKDSQADKKDQDRQDINAGIEAVLTLGKGVKPGGRVGGFVAKLGKWTGFNPNLSSLDNTAGLLAGQVAKKIGGESGRLTDQDRLYALRVMPKSTDTKKEREIKVAVLKTFQDSNVTGEKIREKLFNAMATLYEVDKEKYKPITDPEMLVNTWGKDSDTTSNVFEGYTIEEVE